MELFHITNHSVNCLPPLPKLSLFKLILPMPLGRQCLWLTKITGTSNLKVTLPIVFKVLLSRKFTLASVIGLHLSIFKLLRHKKYIDFENWEIAAAIRSTWRMQTMMAL